MLAATSIVYYVFQLSGVLLLTILTITFSLPQGPSRHLTIPNQNVIWIVQAIFSCLLLFRKHPASDEVPLALCKIQSAVVYGATPALSAAALAVVARLWLLTFTVDRAKSLLVPSSPVFGYGLVALPYIAWFIVAVLAGIISGDNVRRYPQYCASDNQIPSIIANVGAAVILITAAILQAWTGLMVWRRYRQTHQLGSREIGNIDVALFLRISTFSSLILIALVLAFVTILSSWSQAIPDLLVAAMGPTSFFIFGTQRDVLVFWHLAKRQPVSSRSHRSMQGETIGSLGIGQRSNAARGGSTSHAAYGTNAWDLERDLAHQQAGIRSPTLIISSGNKGSMADSSDTEDIELSETKGRDIQDIAHDEDMVRTVRVFSFSSTPPPELQLSQKSFQP